MFGLIFIDRIDNDQYHEGITQCLKYSFGIGYTCIPDYTGIAFGDVEKNSFNKYYYRDYIMKCLNRFLRKFKLKDDEVRK